MYYSIPRINPGAAAHWIQLPESGGRGHPFGRSSLTVWGVAAHEFEPRGLWTGTSSLRGRLLQIYLATPHLFSFC